ncbi:MAG: sensor histidine kinase [Nocardioides sp.]|uniref:sensor histidine kinase n=1 Tax=Nocardioides sp. TaxID=35761 RepID=UPI0039E6E988
MVVPPFLAGLRHGYDGTGDALAAELVVVIGIALGLHGPMSSTQGLALFSSFVLSLGLGLVAGFFRVAVADDPTPDAPYRAARRLLSELLDISGGLSSGLDPVALGEQLANTVQDAVPCRSISVHARCNDGSTTLVRHGDGEADSVLEDKLADEAAHSEAIAIAGATFAIPLEVDGPIVGVVAGTLSSVVIPDQIGLRSLLTTLSNTLSGTAVRLDTALLFAQLRDTATTDERRRLAREMHDGVAQDIASMGYLIDGLIATATSADQTRQLNLLREQVTQVVAEVRRHVLTLRSQIDDSESLGAAVGSVARHLSALSGIPIKVTVDESTTRLRPDVEAELFRITQEALNNAVKHAHASSITVECLINPPEAQIVVEDDGRGLQRHRVDSHGLEIMHERARLVGGDLTINHRSESGTRVAIRLPGLATSVGPRLPRTEEAVA